MSFLYNGLSYFIEKHKETDPRMHDLPLVNNYGALALILLIYWIIVLKVGPAFMTYRKPYNVKKIMQIYNIVQVLWNFLNLCGGTYLYMRHPKYNWFCTNFDRDDVSETAMILRKFTYMYFLNKIFDFMDTIFFVLRKKQNQITFLHVYHHSLIFYGAVVYHRYLFGSLFTAVGIVNSFIHVAMYIYYFLSAEIQDKSRLAVWKRRMTILQLLQFYYIGLKIYLAWQNNFCELPPFWLKIGFFQNVAMIVLFSHFYWRAYIAKPIREKNT